MFEWTPDLAVKDDHVDYQHQGLLNKMAQFEKNKAGDGQALRVILLELIQLTQEHFFYEEEMMESIAYKDLKNHQRIHRNLLKKLQHFAKELQEDDSLNLREHIIIFLEAWLVGHIKQVDHKYSPYLLADAPLNRKKG